MNDLMTNSFQSYVDLKRQSQLDTEQERDLELGHRHTDDEDNLSHFFQEVETIKSDMKEITDLLLDLQNLNEETKSTYSSKILRGLRDRMDSDMVSVLRKAKIVKTRLELLDRSNLDNRKVSARYVEGSAVDRTRFSTTNGLRHKLKEIMNEFQALRERIMSDYKEGLKRRYYNATGEYPSEETMEKMVSGNYVAEVKVFGVNVDENKERHEAVMDIWRSLNKLHQVFLEMAVMVETQGEQLDDIERNVAAAGSFVSGGTNSLFYAKQMKKEGKRRWMCWVWAVVFIILLVCFVAMLTN